jgi:hypothetical protein
MDGPQRINDPPARKGLLFKPENTAGDIARFILLSQGDQGFGHGLMVTLSMVRSWPPVGGKFIGTSRLSYSRQKGPSPVSWRRGVLADSSSDAREPSTYNGTQKELGQEGGRGCDRVVRLRGGCARAARGHRGPAQGDRKRPRQGLEQSRARLPRACAQPLRPATVAPRPPL